MIAVEVSNLSEKIVFFLEIYPKTNKACQTL